ncbi:hypothetical protein [uncultured Tateyamaria sp.]|uniref:plasmid mobilization protein n=1 Tax=uncultured Tateyamaria sp. TaxID=455651 RepID=UPI00262CA272|nr:hypothetical protein [uncultured Tateyamaria sp.]
MSSPHPLSQKAVTDFAAVASTSESGNRRALSPLTLRLTPAERERLKVLAAGMTFSAYARACLFAEDARTRAQAATDPVTNKKAMAEALALLGQSRIASNLNQLAYHANVGALIEDAETKEQIREANAHLLAIRTLLMEGLGKRA